MLKLIARLYQVEKEIREGELAPSAALKLRQKKSTNTHKRIKRVLMILRHRSLPKSELGRACNYSLNNWDYLRTYLNHGQIAIDYRGRN